MFLGILAKQSLHWHAIGAIIMFNTSEKPTDNNSLSYHRMYSYKNQTD